MRSLYSLAWWLLLPLVLARLWWRGRREPAYRQHVAERLACYGELRFKGAKPIWIHAVSVGETRAAEPLVRALCHAYPERSILLTHMTATGRETGRSLFADLGARIVQVYFPYDTAWMAGRFLDRFRPCAGVLMETEVWPNMVAQCARRGIPLLIANARLSERSFRKALRMPRFMRHAAQALAGAGAQTVEDAARLRELGVPRVELTGSMKFDVQPGTEMLARGQRLREAIGPRKVLLCASTREGEEALILDAFEHEQKEFLLMIVPRHPQRFDAVEALLAERGIAHRRRSALGMDSGQEPLPASVQILLGDSMGEMFAYYTACDLAFIGGSLLPLGGQNLIEACMLGKPVLLGPHTFNFEQAGREAVAAGAALRIADADAMLKAAENLLREQARLTEMGERARAFAEGYRGATARTLALLKNFIR